MRAFLRWSLVIALASASSISKADDTSALLARLKAAATQSSLDDQEMKPWHLKVEFQMFDNKGKPSEQGTMEEWWSGPKLYKVVITSLSYSSTVIQNQDGRFYSGATKAPYMLTILPELLLHPMPREQTLAASTPELHRQKFGKAALDCITLKPPKLPEMFFGLFPTYCLDDMNRLRISQNTQMLEAGRTTLGMFQQRTVAIDLFVAANGMKLLTAHIAVLQTYPSESAEFTPTPDMSKVSVPRVLLVGAAATARQKISGPAPVYPERAREQHIAGSVLLSATIGTDGRIHDLEVISDPNDDLAAAATKAVQQWVYKPYLLNGAPTEVQTTITVNFQIGY